MDTDVKELNIVECFTHHPCINITQLAKLIGMNRWLLASYVRGQKIPSTKQVAKIQAGLDEIRKQLETFKLK